jgi:hypothetical protein
MTPEGPDKYNNTEMKNGLPHGIFLPAVVKNKIMKKTRSLESDENNRSTGKLQTWFG